MNAEGSPPPIMVRANITREEWGEIQRRRIINGMTSGDYIARLLRAGMREEDGHSVKAGTTATPRR